MSHHAFSMAAAIETLAMPFLQSHCLEALTFAAMHSLTACQHAYYSVQCMRTQNVFLHPSQT